MAARIVIYDKLTSCPFGGVKVAGKYYTPCQSGCGEYITGDCVGIGGFKKVVQVDNIKPEDQDAIVTILSKYIKKIK